MVLPRALRDELVAHALAEAPNECCGMIALRQGEALAVRRVSNDAASPLRFQMNPTEQLAAWRPIEDAGHDLGIYHSHTRSAPYPSQTDINFARDWPGALHVIVGVTGPEPEIRAYRIDDQRVEEVALTVR